MRTMAKLLPLVTRDIICFCRHLYHRANINRGQGQSPQTNPHLCGCNQSARRDVLYLFGSTARNKANLRSDIDLFLDYNPRGKFSALDLVTAKRLLEAGLGVEVDITTRNGLHPLIRKQIKAEATRVF